MLYNWPLSLASSVAVHQFLSFSLSNSSPSSQLLLAKSFSMASVVANLPPPVLGLGLSKSLPKAFVRPTNSSMMQGQQRCLAIVAKAFSETSESSTSLSIVESVQNVWDKPEDRVAVFGLGFAAIVAIWTSANVVSAIDKLPVLPGVFELVGIFYSSWFVYRNLLFKPDRDEWFRSINQSISDVLGQ